MPPHRNCNFESLQKQTIHSPKSPRVCFLNVLSRVSIFQTQMSACRVQNVEMAALLERDNKNKIAASSRCLLCYSAVTSPPPPHIPISRHFTTIFSLSQISVLSLSSIFSLSRTRRFQNLIFSYLSVWNLIPFLSIYFF
ncbi:hypothetical protein GBA52_011915 [Prunus armeniaca]|nr:hypothetical protein GBA52_011915 [Prunus armeniaca]